MSLPDTSTLLLGIYSNLSQNNIHSYKGLANASSELDGTLLIPDQQNVQLTASNGHVFLK